MGFDSTIGTGGEDQSVAAIIRSLDWARLSMGILAIALTFLPGRGAAFVLGNDLKAAVGLAALAHVGLAIGAITGRSPGWMRSLRVPLVQVAIDSALALAVLAVVDTSAGPLAWIVLLVPLVSAAVMIGASAAVFTWLALSLAYVTLRFSFAPDGVSGGEALSAAIQQLTTLLLTAGLGVIVLRQLRLRSDVIERKLTKATRVAERMESVASVSHKLSRSRLQSEVLEQVVEAAAILGFVDVEVLQLQLDNSWRSVVARFGAGRRESDLLLKQIEAGSPGFVTDSDPRWTQDLHLVGYRSGFAVVLADSPKTVLQGWIGQGLDLERDDVTDGHIFRMFGEQAGMAFRNVVVLDGLERRSRHLTELANSDRLTGLPNRSSLLDSIEEGLEDTGRQIGVLFIDLDGFKAANDRYGHAVGDFVLKELSRRLRGVVPERHTVGRLGGDEFLAVLELSAGLDVEELCLSIIESFVRPISFDQAKIRVGASIGVSYDEVGLSADELVRRADRAMYEAKRSGGETHVVWTAELETGVDSDTAGPTGTGTVKASADRRRR